MTSCKSRGEEGEDCSSMGRKAREDIWGIAMNAADDPHVLSRFRKGDKVSVNANRRDDLGIVCHSLPARGGKSQELGLLRDQGHVVVVTIVNSEKKEVLQAEDVMGEEDAVICLANAGYHRAPDIDSKLGTLSLIKLVVVCQFVEPVTIDSTLLDA